MNTVLADNCKNFVAAMQFITSLPLGSRQNFDLRRMAGFFPLVGLIIGSMVALFDFAAARLWTLEVVSVLDVVLIIVLTGALHLDGLGDTADGLLSHRPRPEALAIMKDSRIGVMALVAIVSILAVKWAGISNIEAKRSLVLILVPGYARGGILFIIRYLAYLRPQEGIGAGFFEVKMPITTFWGFAVLLGLTFLLGIKGLFLVSGFVLITFILIIYFHKRLGGMTGDTLGAAVEILEAGLFLILAV